MITIVSGLPRSGTSMTMQIMEAGGMEPLTDGVRADDEDNPRGYYELERVKRTKADASWLDDAEGKVVKMVYLLLYDLPADRQYQVIFTSRNLKEVVASQNRMLDRLGKRHETTLPDAEVIAMYRKHLAKIDSWLQRQPNMRVLPVSYNQMVTEPTPLVDAINRFVGGHLDVKRMAAVVDRSLYRQRL